MRARLPGVPLLIPVLNVTALAKGFVALHAAAFTYNGTGVLVTGWAKGGKTETLIGFTAKGAQFVGDEWIYIGPDSRVYGLPQPIRVWDWHLPDLPEYRARLTRGDRARMRALLAFQSTGEQVRRARSLGGAGRLLSRLVPLVERQRYASVRPETLFGPESCALSGTLDKLVFVVSHESPDVFAEEVDPLEVADRMAFSQQYERLNLASHLPGIPVRVPARPERQRLERAHEVERRLLTEAVVQGRPPTRRVLPVSRADPGAVPRHRAGRRVAGGIGVHRRTRGLGRFRQYDDHPAVGTSMPFPVKTMYMGVNLESSSLMLPTTRLILSQARARRSARPDRRRRRGAREARVRSGAVSPGASSRRCG